MSDTNQTVFSDHLYNINTEQENTHLMINYHADLSQLLELPHHHNIKIIFIAVLSGTSCLSLNPY